MFIYLCTRFLVTARYNLYKYVNKKLQAQDFVLTYHKMPLDDWLWGNDLVKVTNLSLEVCMELVVSQNPGDILFQG